MASGDTLSLFSALHNSPPTSNYATLDTRNAHPVLDFDASTNEDAVFSDLLRGYAGGGLTVDIWFSMSSAVANDVDWDVAIERIGDEVLDIDADSFAAANSIDNTTVPATSGELTKATVTFTNGADMDSLANGEPYRLKITRDAVSDTAAGDAELHYVHVKET